MNKLNSLQDSYFKKTHISEEKNKDNEGENHHEKVLCNHCGRTSANGIRCLGICVADNDY